jgi:hypothetical protein
MRLLAELDERQVRLGYVNCIVLMAGRQLDTRQALRRRFDNYVFRRIYEETSEYMEFLACIDDEGKRTLAKQDEQRERVRGGSKSARDPVALLQRQRKKGRFRYVSHLWLLQRSLPSHLGPLAPDRSQVFLEHAKHLGLLAETYALTEIGSVLKQLLLHRDPTLPEGRATPNPLQVGSRIAVRSLYLWALLESDVLTPFLVREFVAQNQNGPQLLIGAVEGLMENFARGARVDSAMEMKELRLYYERIGKGAKAAKARAGAPRKRRTTEPGLLAYIERAATMQPGMKIHRHHVRPRLEHYVDVGLLRRREHPHSGDTVYEPSPETSRAVEAWKSILDDPKTVRRFLDTQFFGSTARIFGLTNARECNAAESLLYFSKAFELVGRAIGFTPGRTVAFAACLLALENARVCEIDSIFEAVYAASKTDLGEYLIFSGGSRFDREFLIRVRPEIMPILEKRRAQSEMSNQTAGKTPVGG